MLTRQGVEFPAHFDGKRFYNPAGSQARGWLDLLRWKLTSRPEPSPEFSACIEQSKPVSRVAASKLVVTLVNHSTVLLQQHGLNILTDPIWSDRASPFGWIGPRRRRNPGVRQEDLPPVDVVLLSHNHYDHLNLPTLRSLAQRGDSIFIAPFGVARLLQTEGVAPVRELDWGDVHRIGAAMIHCVPAIHFSGRGIFDRNRSLWCGYIIEAQGRTVYFAGDTAFGDHFTVIRARFGAPRLALLPIGAYAPRWFMAPVHMDPAEAIRAHEILGAAASIAIHHGTFQLGDEAVDTPKRKLAASFSPPSFLVLENGQSAGIL